MRVTKVKTAKEEHVLSVKVLLPVVSFQSIILDCEKWRLQVRASGKQSQKMAIRDLWRSEQL